MDLMPPPDTAAALGTVPVVPQAWVKKRPSPGALAATPTPAPETLHPALWLGHQLGASAAQALASGFAALDAELPGGGWPRRALTELLLPQPGIGEIRLLAASLVAVQRGGRLVMLFDPPARVSAPALVALGLETEALLVVRSRAAAEADSLWAFEQALKSGHVGAAIAWLPPRLRTERLRRLQLAAAAHDGPAFVMREPAQAARPSPAPLRLALRPAGADRLELRLLKRRGPPLAQPLSIVLPPVLPAAARARAQREPATLPAATFVNLV
jgi:protein ImuA